MDQKCNKWANSAACGALIVSLVIGIGGLRREKWDKISQTCLTWFHGGMENPISNKWDANAGPQGDLACNATDY